MKTSVYPAGEPMQGKWVLQLQKKNAAGFRYFDGKRAQGTEKKLKAIKTNSQGFIVKKFPSYGPSNLVILQGFWTGLFSRCFTGQD